VRLSTVVAGELLHGFRCGSRFERNRQDPDEYIASPFVEVIPVTVTTADRCSRVAAAHGRRGAPIPTAAIWVAAQAMETEAELPSLDGH
jgi:tRNA(fMet)-specific endonuclease VapC